MRILLVNMPWASLGVPSLALGILKNCVQQSFPDAEVDVLHANLDYVDWITERFDFALSDYQYYAADTYFAGNGDWVFSSALYDDPRWRLAEFEANRAATMTGPELEMNVRLHELAPSFVGDLAARVVADAPDVVGFTSTFQQNTASLALARRLKALAPHLVTVLGGANCDGPQGAAVHRNFPFVDFVVRGEAEVSFPRLLAALGGNGELAAVPGLCWRDSSGAGIVNPMSTRPLPPEEIVAPDYDGYFERLADSTACDWTEPQLVVEGARGCWWGEKHHCTFCGLNGSFMQFRSKSPARFLTEILTLVERHQVLDMFVVDNILDMGYLNSLLPALAESGYDLRVMYEIKSNLRYQQLETLTKAGLVTVQPGIESLNSRVLKIMDKGVTGCQNARMLRDSSALGLTVYWNYLYGFPGESRTDYDDVVRQLPALHHLYPPEVTARVVIERFSPYFNRPELGFGQPAPAAFYSLVYDLPQPELHDLAYLFTVAPQGVGEDTADELREALDEWRAEFATSRLTYCDLGDAIVLVNRRRHFDWSLLRLTDPVELAAFRLLAQPHTAAGLARKLEDSPTGGGGESGRRPRRVPAPGEVATLLRRWRALGLVFEDDGQFVHVVPEARNQHLLHVDIRRLLGRDEPAQATPVPA